MDKREFLRDAIRKLLDFYGIKPGTQSLRGDSTLSKLSAFGFLVFVILTQNTSGETAFRALMNLISKFGEELDPSRFAGIKESELRELIKVSGMYRLKSRAIINLLEAIKESPEVLEKGDPAELREFLVGIKGVGPKTADVFLLMYRGYPTFPVDTHIKRVLSRLGLVPRDASYESVREFVMNSIPKNLYLTAHLLLIRHGREMCRALKPRCSACPLSSSCPRVGITEP